MSNVPFELSGPSYSTQDIANAIYDSLFGNNLPNNASAKVTVGGNAAVLTGSFTRPTGTVAYSSGDIIISPSGTLIEFADAARITDGSGIINAAIVIDSANQSLLPVLELWLFDANISTFTDNVQFGISDSDMNSLVAVIPINESYVGNTASGLSGNVALVASSINKPYKTKNDTRLYGLLIIRNSYTPVSQEIFSIKLYVVKD